MEENPFNRQEGAGRNNNAQPPHDVAEVRRAAKLFLLRGEVVELRAFDAQVSGLNGRYPVRTVTGYFDDSNKLTDEVARIQSAHSCYILLNPADPRLLARAKNCLVKAKRGGTTNDKYIVRRRFLLVDCDAERPAGISASDEEHKAALGRAQQIRNYLEGRGWPDPVLADSGNGAHLLYWIDVPAEDNGLVQQCLERLAQRFSNEQVKVDKANYNPSRICKLYGTRACKGENTPDRPHRMSRLVQVPDERVHVPQGLLEALAAEVPEEPRRANSGRAATPGLKGSFDLEEFIRAAGLEVQGPDPWKCQDGRGRRWILHTCPFNPDHCRGEAYITQMAGGGISAGCQHESCTWGWPELRQQFDESYSPGTEGRGKGTNGDNEPRKSQATVLVELAESVALWHTPGQGDAYVTLDNDGHVEHWPVRSRTFKRWLCRQYFNDCSRAPASQAVHDAIGLLEGRAIFDGKTHEVAVRVGQRDGKIYLDLANDQWQAVEIDADGWRPIDRCPVFFRRAKAQLPLPVPQSGGSLDMLRSFVNVDDESWPLLMAWLVAALRPTGPFPVLALHGEQGSAKTTTARVLRAIVDPNAAPVRSEPREPRDLMIAAKNGWVIATANLSNVPGWLSDALCRLATGGGFSCRALYENDEEIIFDAQRPTLLTGIEELATRSDLLDRCLVVGLPRIADDQRQTESAFWRAFDAALPAILGTVLDAVSASLRNLSAVSVDRLPRMADFALWATAAEPALGLDPGSFMRSYQDNRETAHTQALESSPIVPYLFDLGNWTGEAKELLQRLDDAASDADKRQKGWPKSPRGLSGVLRRLAPDLRPAGLDVTFEREAARRRRRLIILTRIETQSTVQNVHTVQNPAKQGSEVDGMDATADGMDANRIGASPCEAMEWTDVDGMDGEMLNLSKVVQGKEADNDVAYF